MWHFIDRFLDWINNPEVLLFPWLLFVVALVIMPVVSPEKASEAFLALSTIPRSMWMLISFFVLSLVVEATLNRWVKAGVPLHIVLKTYAQFKLAFWGALIYLIVNLE